MLVKKLFIGLLLFTFFACQPNVKDEITITILEENGDTDAEYVIRTISNRSVEPAAKFTLSEDSYSHMVTIPFEKANMFNISGEIFKPIYAEPGDDLLIKISTNEEGEKTFTYEGSAALYQEILDEFTTINKDFESEHADKEMGQYSLPWEDFSGAMDELSKKKYEAMNSQEGISDAFKDMAKAHIWAKNIQSKRSFSYRWMSMHPDEELKIPEVDNKYVKAFSFPESALASSAFRSLIDFYALDKMTKILEENEEDMAMPERDDHIAVYDYVDSDESIPLAFRERALAVYLGLLTEFADFDVALELKNQFVDRYPLSESRKVLDDQYAKWEPLQPGKPAIDFTYENVKGEIKSLSDFYGNVIYIDVWATWCGPCIAEFPIAKELKARFADADDVIFLYVSVDVEEKKEKWKTDLVKHGLTDGINLFTGKGFESEIAVSYQIQ